MVVFDLIDNDGALSLKYKRSIFDPSFPIGGLNDVVEVAPNEILVTRWKVFSEPQHGKSNPETFQEKALLALEMYAPMVYNAMGAWSCKFDETDASKPAVCDFVISGMGFANGITTNDERTKVWVAELKDHSLEE